MKNKHEDRTAKTLEITGYASIINEKYIPTVKVEVHAPAFVSLHTALTIEKGMQTLIEKLKKEFIEEKSKEELEHVLESFEKQKHIAVDEDGNPYES